MDFVKWLPLNCIMDRVDKYTCANYSMFTLRSQFIENSSVKFAVCDVWNFVPKWREKPLIM